MPVITAILIAGYIVLCAFFFYRRNKEAKKQVSSELQTDILKRILEQTGNSDNPEKCLQTVLDSAGQELKVDRIFIFEDSHDGTYCNTYEWCREGVESKMIEFSFIPYEGFIDRLFANVSEKTGCAVAKDIKKLHGTNERLEELLTEFKVYNVIASPLEAGGERLGFCGVENVEDAAGMAGVSQIIRLLSFYFGQLIVQRNNNRTLLQYSYSDLMTGVGNRRAFEQFEVEELNRGGTYGYVMCDINGLKQVNDNRGHEAGDAIIRDVASILSFIFGENRVYRMGGDEFVVFSFVDNEEELRKHIRSVKVMLKHKNISASIGYVFCDNGNIPYREVKIKADKLMYDAKEEYYKGVNDRRIRR